MRYRYRYRITIAELTDSTREFRDDDEYIIYDIRTGGDNSIVTAVQRTVLDYMEEDHTPPVIMKGIERIESDE